MTSVARGAPGRPAPLGGCRARVRLAAAAAARAASRRTAACCRNTTHLTITPVTESTLPELLPALVAGADAVRGVPRIDASGIVAALPLDGIDELDSETAWAVLQGFGIGGSAAVCRRSRRRCSPSSRRCPAPIAERLLTELIARLAEPDLT